MNLTRSFRRSLAAVILAAGLAYPACAAVCPKGIGGCPSPGRCFLFTDADGNAFCDYTGRAAVPNPAGQAPSATTAAPDPAAAATTSAPAAQTMQPAVTATQVPASPDTMAAVLPPGNTTVPLGAGGTAGNASWPVPVTAAILFVVLTGIFYALFRHGTFGIRIDRPLPALGLSVFLSLGFSLMSASLLSGAAVAGTGIALIYMGAGSVIAAYLWRSGQMVRKVVLLTTLVSALTGFVFLSPIMPLELGGLINVLSGVSPLSAGILMILGVITFALVAGRTFCGSVCPVGSLQELVSSIPVPKIRIRPAGVPELIRLAVFAATAIAALYLIDLMAVTGLYDFFSLALSASFALAAGLVILSAFVYRPVCRLLCPFGVLFSIPAGFSRFRLHRTGACIECGRCEQACLAGVAGRNDAKRECYLCGRCTAACRVKGALVYGRATDEPVPAAIRSPGRVPETAGQER